MLYDRLLLNPILGLPLEPIICTLPIECTLHFGFGQVLSYHQARLMLFLGKNNRVIKSDKLNVISHAWIYRDFDTILSLTYT